MYEIQIWPLPRLSKGSYPSAGTVRDWDVDFFFKFYCTKCDCATHLMECPFPVFYKQYHGIFMIQSEVPVYLYEADSPCTSDIGMSCLICFDYTGVIYDSIDHYPSLLLRSVQYHVNTPTRSTCDKKTIQYDKHVHTA